MILLDFEKEIINSQKGVPFEVSDAEINEKYEKGEARIITEQGAVKLCNPSITWYLLKSVSYINIGGTGIFIINDSINFERFFESQVILLWYLGCNS